MIFIGIVGALSPSGQKMIEALQLYPQDYKVIWTVDENYAADNRQMSQFKDLENVLILGLQPSLVLDFGSYKTTYERAKIYRRYAVPAIMQGVLSAEELSFLSNCGQANKNGEHYAPLVVEPDFSIVKIQMVKDLLCQVQHLTCKVQRIYVRVKHNAHTEDICKMWLYWATMINAVLGEYTELPTAHASGFTLGFVRVSEQYKPEMEPNDEHLSIKLLLDKPNESLEWNLACSLTDTRVEGALLLLEWYKSERENLQDLVFGQVSVEVLPLLI